MYNRKINWELRSRIFLSFLIATFILLDVFLISYSISYYNYQQINEQNNLIYEYLMEINASLSRFSCDGRLLFEASYRLDDVGAKLDILERRFGFQDERVLEQKKLYTELEFLHFNLIKRLNQACDNTFPFIFFFYSNYGNIKEESDRIASVLSSLKRQNSNVMIYSFDYNLDSGIIGNLKRQHNIVKVPSILINEKDIFYSPRINEIQGYL